MGIAFQIAKPRREKIEIKAAVTFKQSDKFKIEQLDLSGPNDDEVLVRIVASGIWHTDLAARHQRLPIPLPSVLGHEGAGVVEKVGKWVTKVKPADHVAVSWMSCGQCASCKAGYSKRMIQCEAESLRTFCNLFPGDDTSIDTYTGITA